MRLPACFWQFGSPGYDFVLRTRDEGEGYVRAKFFYHRWSDAFHTRQTLERTERTERISVGNYAPCERWSDMPEGLDFLLAGEIEINRSNRLRRRLFRPFSPGLAEAGATSGIRRLYLGFER
ncbi:MAG: hypothetical protein ABI469_08415 [Gemmatimonadales bacterium]